jgi:hydroxyproline O-arabinosyltransferase
VSRGRPVAQPISYLNPAHERNLELVRKHCRNPESVQGVGIPILIHRDDLAVVAPLWLKKTEDIRCDPESREVAGWVAEMWAYAFAAAELGLQHTTGLLARVSTDDQADLPLVHYCYSYSDPEVHWTWDKRAYRPWEKVPDPPDEVPLGTKVLIGLLNEWVGTQEHQICLH